MKEHYRCWYCAKVMWYTKEELIKRIEEKNKHIDLVCPKCERTIICRR